MRLVALVLATCAACKPADTFSCTTGDECREGAVTGTCEPTGYCAFPDGACASGRRYDPSAGPTLAGMCVPPDGPPPDRPPPDLAPGVLPIDCRDALEHGAVADGVVTIDPDGANT